MDVGVDPGDEQGRNLGVHQVVGESHGDADDQQHPAGHGDALDGGASVILAQGEVAVDEALDHQRIGHGERASLDQRAETSEQSDEHDHGEGQLPLGFPER